MYSGKSLKNLLFTLSLAAAILGLSSCAPKAEQKLGPETITAKDILGNPEYRAISYGGYRENSREIQPAIPQLKEDMKILHAAGIRLLRTYNVHLPQAANLLKAIRELRAEDPGFEMYVMLGAWIDCKNAWTTEPDRIRDQESPRNSVEIETAVTLANEYPDVVKILAVGNEAMVHWAWDYHVEPSIILKWVRHLQDLKAKGKLPETLWITSSDDYASWGGGGSEYHKEALNQLIEAVDFISAHTYPYHNTHYNPEFWKVPEQEESLSKKEQIDAAMLRARDFAIAQYQGVLSYVDSLGIDKPVHIGETGWSTISDGFYGPEGSKATDQYKQAMYHKLIREWSDQQGISVFYFEAFDEQWKDAQNPLGSENHFGMINLKSEAKYAWWDLVDQGIFEGLTRDGKPITKTFGGDMEALMNTVEAPPLKNE